MSTICENGSKIYDREREACCQDPLISFRLTFFFFFFLYINVNLKLNKIQYSVPSIAEKDMTSSGSGYERHLQFL